MRKIRAEISSYENEFIDSQRSLVINELQLDRLDSLKISQTQKVLKLREDLEKKYDMFYPTSGDSFRKFIEKVETKDQGKVLRTCVKIAKNDFKSLKSDHILFKQRKLSNEQLIRNLMTLYGSTHQSTGVATLCDIKQALENL